jgi:hypothetical protein
MPVIFRYKGFRFFFFSNEGDPREPVHIHVKKGLAAAKFWIDPVVSVAQSRNITAVTLAELARVIEARKSLIERRWYEYFSE